MRSFLRPPEAPAAIRFRRRFAALRRDVATVLADLGGRPPAPLIARPPGRHVAAAAPAVSATTAAARPMVVRALHRETRDATTIVLADPAGAPIRFVPGQFLTLVVTIDGEPHRRAYSICSSVDDTAQVAVTSKRVPGGRVSTYLNERLRVGDVVHVLGPSGEFTVAPDPAARRSLVLIAGGSGITPILAILRAVLAHEPDTRATLVYGNRTAGDVIFLPDLDALAARHPGRLVVRHVLERVEPGDPPATVGRLDRATVAAELAAIADRCDAETDYFVCGPTAAMDAALEELAARGVPAARVHQERFATPERRVRVRVAQHMTVRRAGAVTDVVVGPDATLLDAGLAAGVPMAYSCAMGGCGACAVDLVAGDVDLDEPNCLTPDERARGRILACVARPCGPVTIDLDGGTR